MYEKKFTTPITVTPADSLDTKSPPASRLPGTNFSHGRNTWNELPNDFSQIPAQIVQIRHRHKRNMKIYTCRNRVIKSSKDFRSNVVVCINYTVSTKPFTVAKDIGISDDMNSAV